VHLKKGGSIMVEHVNYNKALLIKYSEDDLWDLTAVEYDDHRMEGRDVKANAELTLALLQLYLEKNWENLENKMIIERKLGRKRFKKSFIRHLVRPFISLIVVFVILGLVVTSMVQEEFIEVVWFGLALIFPLSLGAMYIIINKS
jgi:hypothetical protein